MTGLFGLLLSASLASALLTGCIRRYALKANLLDTPNRRSSHTIPTPRGGGLAFVLVFLAGLIVLFEMDLMSRQALWAYTGAGAGVALIGFADDHRHIPPGWRLMAHFIAAGWGLFWLGGLPSLLIFGVSYDTGWIGQALSILFLVWALNLYNFMDGIDGLAGIEAVTVCLGAILLALTSAHGVNASVPSIMAVSVAGFLWWNFPPAKIFMGDVGSGFLGITLALMAIEAAGVAPQLLWSWLILLGVFIVDATLTLFRRLVRGEAVHEAHRSHAYQYASRYYRSHKAVTLCAGAINLCWLTPLALLVALNKLDGVTGLILAYAPLLLLAVKFNAGVREVAT